MVGKGRPRLGYGVLGVFSTDPVLSLLAALGLAQTARSSLVIDLCGDLALPGRRTLSDLVAEGPSLSELSPGRPGVALLSAGPIPVDEVGRALEMLASNWPAVVLRCGSDRWDGPVVPVRPLLPGLLATSDDGPAVWQPVFSLSRPPGPGPVLPHLRSSLVRRLLSGRAAGGARWVKAWSPVWGMPWA